jgi:predicted nucleotidyltransferase
MKNIKRVQKITADISQEFHKTFSNTTHLIWFGSWVKGNAYEQSDIDLAIKNLTTIDDEKLLKFKQYLSNFPTLYKIDLVDMRHTNELLQNEINKYGKLL